MSGFAWTPGAVREALGLRTEVQDEGVAYSGISTDSRSITEGALYLALRGERFDGHDFVAEAFARGARGAVVSRPVEVQSSEQLYPVDDTLVALGALAAYRRQALDVPVVAITGSCTIIPPSTPVPGMVYIVKWFHFCRPGKQVPI